MRFTQFFPPVSKHPIRQVKQPSISRIRRAGGLFLLLACCWTIVLFSAKAASATTYYLAPASEGGNDGNNGLSATRPWLSPNHYLNCGDVILAEPSTSYNSYYFGPGHWGTVNCPAGNSVAWLQCEQFDACKIYSTNEGVYVDHPYWGVQGWEVTVEPGAYGFCFGAAPSGNYYNEVHHVIFANNVANGCQAGGIVGFNQGQYASVDYIAIIGNIVYNAAQGGSNCYTGISIFQPIQSDSQGGTHIYIAGNFSYGNYQPYTCAGGRSYGGDGIILDTFDGSEGHLPYPYAAQTVAENNILVGNGGMGLEIQNNVAGYAHGAFIVRHNTAWNNEQSSYQQSNGLCSEMSINSAYNVQEYNNLAVASTNTACAGNTLAAFRIFTGNNTDAVWSNFFYAVNGQNLGSYNVGSFLFGSNATGQNPYLAAPTTPPAPYCSGTSNTTNCMTRVIENFTPTNSAASSMGYKWPSTTWAYDPNFPQWVCNVNLPQGLVTMGC